MEEFTRTFNTAEDKDLQIRHVLTTVYEALKEKGYDPINQLVGYIISGDPTYITSYGNARALICRLERDEILEEILTYYIRNRQM